jgi:hypothetical protein
VTLLLKQEASLWLQTSESLFVCSTRGDHLLYFLLSLFRTSGATRLCTSLMQYDLEKFRSIYLDEFGDSLSDEEAERKARMLLNLYLAVYRSVVEVIKEVPLTDRQYEQQ